MEMRVVPVVSDGGRAGRVLLTGYLASAPLVFDT
jgi:hypothetical protein